MSIYPTSNVRIVPAPFHILTESSFGECEDCERGRHGLLKPGTRNACDCCGWPRDPQYRVGYRIPARSQS